MLGIGAVAWYDLLGMGKYLPYAAVGLAVILGILSIDIWQVQDGLALQALLVMAGAAGAFTQE